MQINLARKTQYLTEEVAHKKALRHARKKLGVRDVQLESIVLKYKLFYFLKVLAIASRFPFKPKRSGYVIFFDSILAQGGLTAGIPMWDAAEVAEDVTFPPSYSLERFSEKQSELIEKFILRRYMLKRPELEFQGTERVWLPYYLCAYAASGMVAEVLLNAETGQLDI